MKIMKKIFITLLVIIILLVALVFAFRFYNDYKYKTPVYDMDSQAAQLFAQYQNPSDLSLYWTDIDGLDIKHIKGEYLNGFSITPDTVTREGVVVTFGGSEGSPGYERAVQIAQEGYQVLALFFFGVDNQKPTLAEVPVEYYKEIESYIFENYGEDTEITLVGASKGAEYILLLSTYYPSIKNVIAYVPSAYVYSGLDFTKNTSSWSFEGKPLPYVDVMQGDFFVFAADIMWPFLTKGPISYARSYEIAARQDANIEAKTIPVEKSEANIVLFAGDDDQMWKSYDMAKAVQQRRPANTEVLIYEGAGHIFSGNGVSSLGGMRMAMGGSLEANMEAFRKNNQDLFEVLSKWHEERGDVNVFEIDVEGEQSDFEIQEVDISHLTPLSDKELVEMLTESDLMILLASSARGTEKAVIQKQALLKAIYERAKTSDEIIQLVSDKFENSELGERFVLVLKEAY